jgi:hypothetical protein
MPSAPRFVAPLKADPFEHSVDLSAVDYLASVAVKLAQLTIDNPHLADRTRFKSAVGTFISSDRSESPVHTPTPRVGRGITVGVSVIALLWPFLLGLALLPIVSLAAALLR